FVQLENKCKEYADKFVKQLGRHYWRKNFAQIMILDYYNKLGSFNFEKNIVDETVSDFNSAIHSKYEKIFLVYSFQNFNAENSFSLNKEISFHPVTYEDLKIYAVKDQWIFQTHSLINLTDWICEISINGRKDTYDDINNANEIINNIQNALFLTKKGCTTVHLKLKVIQNPFLSEGSQIGGLKKSSGIGNPIFLDVNDIQRFINYYKIIRKIENDDKYKFLRYPLIKIRDAVNRSKRSDTFLDYIIALETLIAHDTEALESTYRFRLRGAFILNSEFGTARSRINLLSKLYGIRSDIVHGRKIKEGMYKLVLKLDDIVRSIFRYYLHRLYRTNPKDLIRVIDEKMVG
ncbi:MAG: hypothetical protein KAT54_02180, partial [Candidatus Marinimicrobia bacterium]|nr:hypothetical protein [Candidatus Neomarinimicrobiota bacterium]